MHSTAVQLVIQEICSTMSNFNWKHTHISYNDHTSFCELLACTSLTCFYKSSNKVKKVEKFHVKYNRQWSHWRSR